MKTQKTPIVISKLIIGYLKDDLSAEENIVFEEWLAADPSNRLLIESFRDTHPVQQDLNYFHQVDVNEGWSSFLHQVQPRPKVNWKKIIAYSSAALVAIALGIGLQNAFHPTDTEAQAFKPQEVADIMPGSSKVTLAMADGTTMHLTGIPARHQVKEEEGIIVKDGFLCYSNLIREGYNTLTTPKAGEYKVMLPDGSKVFLNAESTLKFPANFNQNRNVELKGEAYFEVAHHKGYPFRVSFNDTRVEVLGTHFNINSYDQQSKTTLLEGSVRISGRHAENLLKPGQEAVTADGNININRADTYKSIAWKEGMFYFREDDMTEILAQVARWYNVEIKYLGKPSIKKYSGDIRRQATLNQVLAMLTAVSGGHFSLNNRTVTVDF